MAVAISRGAEVQRPLATVVIGSLITATVLTLCLLLMLYPWLSNKDEKRPQQEQKTQRECEHEAEPVHG